MANLGAGAGLSIFGRFDRFGTLIEPRGIGQYPTFYGFSIFLEKTLAKVMRLCYNFFRTEIRVWRSLVSRLNGVQEAAGSNPVTRTNFTMRKVLENTTFSRTFLLIFKRPILCCSPKVWNSCGIVFNWPVFRSVKRGKKTDHEEVNCQSNTAFRALKKRFLVRFTLAK